MSRAYHFLRKITEIDIYVLQRNNMVKLNSFEKNKIS